jgi:hypothetical protein
MFVFCFGFVCCKGNCVIFMDNISRFTKCATSVLDLDEGRLSPMSGHSRYSSLFCKPLV